MRFRLIVALLVLLLFLSAPQTSLADRGKGFGGAGGAVADAFDPGSGSHTPASTTFNATVNIADPNVSTIKDVDVVVNLTHSALDELRIILTPPVGSPLTLLNDRTDANGNSNSSTGMSGANLINTVFDQEAAQSIHNNTGGAASQGHFRPEQGNLASLYGLTPAQLNGTWQLTVTDFRHGHTGTLTSWSVVLLGATTVQGATAIFHSVVGPVADAVNPGTGPHTASTTVFVIAVSLSDPEFAGVEDLNVHISLTHPALNELRLVLVAPDNTTITLLRNRTDNIGNNNPSAGASGANLVNTIFDQGAAQSIYNNTGGIASSGNFRPEVGSLAVFHGRTPAQVNGAWQLQITDYRAGNAGMLTDWALAFTSQYKIFLPLLVR